ncbi:MAG: phosphatidate cytidylyltransferase [Flavobacteriaceae bacterium]
MSETLVRAISGAVYVAILLFACWYSEASFKILIGIFLVLATIEFSKLIRFNTIIGVLLALGFYIPFGVFEDVGNQFDLVFVFFSIITAFWLIKKLFSSENLIVNEGYKKYLIFLGYIVFSFILLSKIPFENTHLNTSEQTYHPLIIILIFVMIWINDTFAYLIGKTFGKHKLLERISPKKTVEGFLGGAFFTIIFSLFIPKIFDWKTETKWFWLILPVIIITFATLGDLVESKFKRSANVKDSGNIMPGHGGILDRLDSIILVVPFVFLFYQIINYVS